MPLRLGSKGAYSVYYTLKPWSRLEVNPKPRGRKLPPGLAVVGANGGLLPAGDNLHQQSDYQVNAGPDNGVTREESRLEGAPGRSPKDARDVVARPETGARTDWFPTSVWRFNVADHQALNEKLSDSSRMTVSATRGE